MSDSYLIDGYNLIHALGMLDRQAGEVALRQSRRRLLDFLHASMGDASVQVTVVFDAQHGPRHVPHQQSYHGLHIHFTSGTQSADDLIEARIDEDPAPRALVMISNDMRLHQAAHRRGSRAWTHTDFLDFLERRRAAAQPAPSAEEKQAGPMSPEEKEHWMKEFKSLEQDSELKEFFDMDRFE